ncbi:hypothetical protein ACEWY4_000149 [Coilia grayii]|uniref:Uncharacterized protein n=1 Tax=Coilia grayii TaxID=363190 RepID=A0ABD1KW99_9TELE
MQFNHGFTFRLGDCKWYSADAYCFLFCTEGFGGASGMSRSMEGGAAGGTLPPGLTEEEAEELRVELSKVEDEIQTLKQVLSAKERHAGDIKRQLGISPLSEIKQNISKGWQDVQSSNAYKKTQEAFSQAGQMTSEALSTMGAAISQRIGTMRWGLYIYLTMS